MKITKFKYEGVGKDGKVKSGGAVGTKGGIVLVEGSCPLQSCHCSDGYSISIIMPLKNQIVEGIHVKFKDYNEMKQKLRLTGIVSEDGKP